MTRLVYSPEVIVACLRRAHKIDRDPKGFGMMQDPHIFGRAADLIESLQASNKTQSETIAMLNDMVFRLGNENKELRGA